MTLSFHRRHILLLFIFVFISSSGRLGAQSALPASSIPQEALIQPAALHQILISKSAAQPLILQVGSRVMFAEAHIHGAVYAGPGSDLSGLKLLASKVASVPKSRFIVLYCGCCPWSHCPNIAPAFRKLQDLGFTNVKTLYIASNFGDDWVAKNYPVDHGL